MEAQAAGCVVITSALAALPETVGDAGFLIRGIPGTPHYAKSFIDSAHRLLSDPDLFQRLSQKGRHRAQAEFSWEQVADRFEILFQLPKAQTAQL